VGEGAGVVAFGADFDLDGDGLGAQASGLGEEVDDVAESDGCAEVDAVDGGGDPAVVAVAAGLDESGLVDVAEDDAAEDGAVLVGIAGHGDHAEGEAGVGGGVEGFGGVGHEGKIGGV
jgi:hypothetical protein